MTLEPGKLEDSFLTVAEVAGMLKLNQQTVRNWIDQGSLPALRVGRRVRIRRSDLERLLERGSTAAAGGVTQATGPSAEDFWGGELVGVAEPAAGTGFDGPPNGPATADRGSALPHAERSGPKPDPSSQPDSA